MLLIHETLLDLHVVLGALALILFWIPIFARKGGPTHVRYGKIYVWLMYIVAVSGVVMSVMVLVNPGYFKPNASLTSVYQFYSLLLFLSALTFVSVRHAMLVLKHKTDTSVFRRFGFLWMPATLVGGGIALLIIAVSSSSTLILHYVFSGLGMFIGASMGHFAFRKNPPRKIWLTEHIGAILGSGIAAYTAFLAFGARNWLSVLGDWQLAAWILPSVVGTAGIIWATRRWG